MAVEDKILWDKQALIDYVITIIRDEFDDEIECSVEYSKNYLVIE